MCFCNLATSISEEGTAPFNPPRRASSCASAKTSALICASYSEEMRRDYMGGVT